MEDIKNVWRIERRFARPRKEGRLGGHRKENRPQ
jgi:hypothetical protein